MRDIVHNFGVSQAIAPADIAAMHVKSIKARPDLRMVPANWRPGCQRCNAKEAADERRAIKGQST